MPHYGLAMVWGSIATMGGAAALSGGAQTLSWHQAQKAPKVAPSAEQVSTTFPFENRTGHPVTITRVRSSCGCTVATLDKTIYQPGEPGEIRVTFRFDDRVGRHTKRITVETDEADDGWRTSGDDSASRGVW